MQLSDAVFTPYAECLYPTSGGDREVRTEKGSWDRYSVPWGDGGGISDLIVVLRRETARGPGGREALWDRSDAHEAQKHVGPHGLNVESCTRICVCLPLFVE